MKPTNCSAAELPVAGDGCDEVSRQGDLLSILEELPGGELGPICGVEDRQLQRPTRHWRWSVKTLNPNPQD